MPRVLRIINRLNLGGPTFNAAFLTHFLQPEYETMLVAGMKDDSEASSEFILERYGIKPVYVKEMMREIDLRNDWTAYRKLRQIIKEYKPDIVHTHAAKAGMIGRIAASQAKVPVILHTFHGHVFHSYFSPAKTKLFIQIERYLAKKSSAIVAISNEQKRELAEDFKICHPDKIRVVPLGFDLDKFRQDTDIKRLTFRNNYLVDADEIVITIIGRLVPIKNHTMFLKGIANLKNRSQQKIRAFIVGDGESRAEVEQTCRELGLDFCDALKEKKKAIVTFTSWLTDIDVVCAGADIIAMTSLNEGTPVSLIEAQAGNKPIVSTEVGGIKDIVSPQTALLCASNDTDTFTDHLLKLTENEKLRKDMSCGWDVVGSNFSYQRLCKDMRGLYGELLKNV